MAKSQKVKRNYSLEPETVETLESFSASTKRKPGEVIDWLIADAKDRSIQRQRKEVPVEQALASPK